MSDIAEVKAALEEMAQKKLVVEMDYHGWTSEEFKSEYNMLIEKARHALSALARIEAGGVEGWQPPETAPKDGKPFFFTSTGPEVDICSWVEERQQFEDYFFKQRIGQLWPYMIGWMPLPKPAIIMNTEAETRAANGWPLPPPPATPEQEGKS